MKNPMETTWSLLDKMRVMQNEQSKVTWSKLSKEHKEIHAQMQRLKDDIDWSERRIARANTHGGLIEIAKNLKERKLRDEVQAKHDRAVERFKKKILKLTGGQDV